MDPTATLQRFVDAVDDEDREEAVAALRDLADWLESGGFYPSFAAVQRLV